MKHLVTLITSIFVAMSMQATDYATLQVKAQRFYHYQEWPSAIAMYTLMLQEQPAVPSTYAHAIVAAGMQQDPARQVAFLRQSMDAHVPLDSIYDLVQQLAFEQGNAPLYENFLESTGNTFHWLRRNIDARLLQYYTWRRNANSMVIYARRMLDGLPDNTDYLTALADGLMLRDDQQQAIDIYLHILAIDPDNYHALLVLGNYYDNLSHLDRFNTEAPILARQYLSRADALRPTPYVTNLLNR